LEGEDSWGGYDALLLFDSAVTFAALKPFLSDEHKHCSQTGKTTLLRLLTEGCLDPRTVRNVPADPRYPLGSLYTPPGARLWANGDALMEDFLKVVSEDMLLKLIDGSSQAYMRKNHAAIEQRNVLPGVIASNRDAGSAANDAGGSMSSRIVYFPFFRVVRDTMDSLCRNVLCGMA
jgi:hypothetical protein